MPPGAQAIPIFMMQVWSQLRRLHSCLLSALLVAAVAVVCCVELGVLRRWELKDYECEMTYLYWKPKFIDIPLPDQIREQFPDYALFVYGEAMYAQKLAKGLLMGFPVLYIPGNGGSHQQVRASASIAYLMGLGRFPGKRSFNFFTVTFNEELSGVYGGVLKRQTEFVALCIDHILSLYRKLNPTPSSVPILAHSMGGVVARALFSIPWFNPLRVRLIITMATPHLKPIIPLDHHLQEMYASIDKVWKSDVVTNVTLVSVNGGWKDGQVLPVTSYVRLPNSLNAACPAVPRVWAASTHQEIVWCRRLQLALVQSLFQLQNQSGNELLTDSQRTRHHFCKALLNPCPLPPPTAAGTVSLPGSVLPMTTANYFSRGHSRGRGKEAKWRSFSVLLLGRHTRYVLVAVDRMVPADSGWLWACNGSSECVDMTSNAIALPPTYGSNHTVVVVDLQAVSAKELIVAEPPKQDGAFLLVSPFHQPNVSVSLPVLRDSFTLSPEAHLTFIPLHSPRPPLVVQHFDVLMQCEGVESDFIGKLVAGIYPNSALKTTNMTKTDDGLFVAHLGVTFHPSEVLEDTASLLLWLPSLECRLQVSIEVDHKGTVLQFILHNAAPLLQMLSVLSLVRLVYHSQPHSILWDGLAITVLAVGGFYSHFDVQPFVYIAYMLCSCIHGLANTTTAFLGVCKERLCLRGFQSPLLWFSLCLASCACCLCCGSLGLLTATAFAVFLMVPWQLNTQRPLLPAVACGFAFTVPSLVAWSRMWRSIWVVPQLQPDPFAVSAAVLSVGVFSWLCIEAQSGPNFTTSKQGHSRHSSDLIRSMFTVIGQSMLDSVMVITSYQIVDISPYLWLLAGVVYMRLHLH